jgi:hypothetical protein
MSISQLRVARLAALCLLSRRAKKSALSFALALFALAQFALHIDCTSRLYISLAHAGHAAAVSADAAHSAVAQGAFELDVRRLGAFTEGHLTHAAWLAEQRWLWLFAKAVKMR